MCYFTTCGVTISNTRAKHIKYRYHNASHVMYNVIYVSARHVQWLFQILAQKHIHNTTLPWISICFFESIWNRRCTCRTTTPPCTSCCTKITLQVTTLRSLRWNRKPAVTISNIPTETYQISISQRFTRHASRNVCYTTTPAVTISNTRAEAFQISISQRYTRHASRNKTTPI